MPDTELLLFACELRTRATEILVRAADTDDLETQETMRLIAVGHQKLALRVEQRLRDRQRRCSLRPNRERSDLRNVSKGS